MYKYTTKATINLEYTEILKDEVSQDEIQQAYKEFRQYIHDKLVIGENVSCIIDLSTETEIV